MYAGRSRCIPASPTTLQILCRFNAVAFRTRNTGSWIDTRATGFDLSARKTRSFQRAFKSIIPSACARINILGVMIEGKKFTSLLVSCQLCFRRAESELNPGTTSCEGISGRCIVMRLSRISPVQNVPICMHEICNDRDTGHHSSNTSERETISGVTNCLHKSLPRDSARSLRRAAAVMRSST